jgi:hypothetical protein
MTVLALFPDAVGLLVLQIGIARSLALYQPTRLPSDHRNNVLLVEGGKGKRFVRYRVP